MNPSREDIEESGEEGHPVDPGKQQSGSPRLVSEHVIVQASRESPAVISLKPLVDPHDGRIQLTKDIRLPEYWDHVRREEDMDVGYEEGMEKEGYGITSDRKGGWHEGYPEDPTPVNYRVPLEDSPKGFMYIEEKDRRGHPLGFMPTPSHDRKDIPGEYSHMVRQSAHEEPLQEYVTEETFQKICDDFKGEEGRFLALTAYGAVPLPQEMLKTIPEKFDTKPVIEEWEMFVRKRDNVTRVSHQEYTQYEHKFEKVRTSIVVEKIRAIDDVQVIEVPYFKYKPVVEEKVLEIPCGVKYVEVPIEVPCSMPPRILPIPKAHIVERVIMASKPVVQEKIIEIPEIVKKEVPKVVVKEIPYIVPKYVEKIIEVPYDMCDGIPEPYGVERETIPVPVPLPVHPPRQYMKSTNDPYGTPYGARVGNESEMSPEYSIENGTMILKHPGKHLHEKDRTQTFYLDEDVKHVKLPYEAEIEISVEEHQLPPRVPNLNGSKIEHFASNQTNSVSVRPSPSISGYDKTQATPRRSSEVMESLASSMEHRKRYSRESI